MTRAELETTAPIKRDELLDLLNTMSPEQEPITARRRTSHSDAVQARAARKAAKRAARKAAKKAAKAAAKEASADRLEDDVDWVDWDQLATAPAMITPAPPEPVPLAIRNSTSESSKPQRNYPFAHVAALLPPCEPTRFPRATRPPLVRASTPSATSDTAGAQKAAQAVAEVRARLDTAEETAAERAASRERVSFAAMSPQVVAQLSAEEIAMLSIERTPEGWHSTTPPHIAMTPDDVVAIHSVPCNERGHAIRVSTRERAGNALELATIITSLAATFVVGIYVVYFLL
ncbi:MAG TPA: hypothetical protein VIV11_39920 [Kofleriaceae bacterium]